MFDEPKHHDHYLKALAVSNPELAARMEAESLEAQRAFIQQLQRADRIPSREMLEAMRAPTPEELGLKTVTARAKVNSHNYMIQSLAAEPLITNEDVLRKVSNTLAEDMRNDPKFVDLDFESLEDRILAMIVSKLEQREDKAAEEILKGKSLPDSIHVTHEDLESCANPRPLLVVDSLGGLGRVAVLGAGAMQGFNAAIEALKHSPIPSFDPEQFYKQPEPPELMYGDRKNGNGTYNSPYEDKRAKNRAARKKKSKHAKKQKKGR
ncbi:hypothetical protein [Vibrio phage vB_VhaS-a]|nr:hypothetical protein [Vibrio phage vB_VhaS-a]